jgi:predicted nucleotidyltransferase component of viral defense system
VQEALQVQVLKIIFQSKYGIFLSFMGGTCLRICHDMKRFSEDLDFSLDQKSSSYHFPLIISMVERELKLLGLSVASNSHADKIVQKSFLRISHLQEILDLSHFRKNQKLHIKVGVDIRPPRIKSHERESFFVNRCGEIFPILKHSLPTLFAGKVMAILQRPYARGRDYYDLIWYLKQKIAINLDYLNRGLKGGEMKSLGELWDRLDRQIATVKPEIILRDIDRFLEDPSEIGWILRYRELFHQLVSVQDF